MNVDLIRISFFIFLLFVLFALESLIPKRKFRFPRIFRWKANFSLVLVDAFILKFFFPILAYGVAVFALNNELGLFNSINFLGISSYITILLSFILLDLVIYIQHVMFHRIPFLWRYHKLHHSDLDLDFTSGFRFHPIEIIISMIIKCSAVLAIGAPPISVLFFEIILNASSLFNHANLSIKKPIDSFLRIFIVTPDMHRIHHSIKDDETDSNFAFCLSLWDKLFGTYKGHPARGHKKMLLGLKNYRSLNNQTIKWIFLMPFQGIFIYKKK